MHRSSEEGVHYVTSPRCIISNHDYSAWLATARWRLVLLYTYRYLEGDLKPLRPDVGPLLGACGRLCVRRGDDAPRPPLFWLADWYGNAEVVLRCLRVSRAYIPSRVHNGDASDACVAQRPCKACGVKRARLTAIHSCLQVCCSNNSSNSSRSRSIHQRRWLRPPAPV